LLKREWKKTLYARPNLKTKRKGVGKEKERNCDGNPARRERKRVVRGTRVKDLG